MLLTILGGSALIVALVALYYTNKAYGTAQAAIHVLVESGIIEVKEDDEE